MKKNKDLTSPKRIARVFEERPVSPWMPIESAPRDGDRDVTIEFPFSANKGPAIAYDDDTGEALYLVWFSALARGISETTHWMPLPPPPA